MPRPYVFISHSTQDRTIAGMVCQALEQQHIPCWIAPRDVPLGLNAFDAIPRGIEECRVLVLILSGKASQSDYVQRELQLALSQKKIIIPLRIEDIPLDRAVDFLLTGVQWLDAFVPPLERHVDALVNRIAAIVEVETLNDSPIERKADPFFARKKRRILPIALGAGAVLGVLLEGAWFLSARIHRTPQATATAGAPLPVPRADNIVPTKAAAATLPPTPPRVSPAARGSDRALPHPQELHAGGGVPAAARELSVEELRAEAAVKTAQQKMRDQDFVSAENYFSLAVRLDPDNAAAKAGLKSARHALGEE